MGMRARRTEGDSGLRDDRREVGGRTSLSERMGIARLDSLNGRYARFTRRGDVLFRSNILTTRGGRGGAATLPGSKREGTRGNIPGGSEGRGGFIDNRRKLGSGTLEF